VAEREARGDFAGVDAMVERCARQGAGLALGRRELNQLARVGALNDLEGVEHRRDALWQVERAGRPAGPLLTVSGDEEHSSPLKKMTVEERLVADYAGSGLTTGPHPLAYRRRELRAERILSAAELARARHGGTVRTAGCVIARQRPGTASGFIFLSMEDETGISNVIIHPELYDRQRMLVIGAKFLLVEGRLQNEDGVVHVRAERVEQLSMAAIETRSHDFH
jgi:error-prone DNA polymerase